MILTKSLCFAKIPLTKDKENIREITELSDIKDNGLLVYKNGYYGRVIKVGQKNFKIEDEQQQNIDIDYFANALKMLEETQSADIVKIDREILLRSEKEDRKKLFLGVISLMQNLNLKVVCEGVETEEQNQLVSDSDCDYIQGWYYTKALPEKDAEDFARNYKVEK